MKDRARRRRVGDLTNWGFPAQLGEQRSRGLEPDVPYAIRQLWRVPVMECW